MLGITAPALLCVENDRSMSAERQGGYIDNLALDPGIRDAVEILRSAGVETFESCQGGEGHAFSEPTVRFYASDRAEGFRALSVAMRAQLPVAELRRVWVMQDGEPVGPYWEMTFTPNGG